MTKEEQIVEILTKASINSPTAGRTILYENDFDYVAEEIVKLFAIPDVSGQSKNEDEKKVYMCTVCQQVPVDVDNGYDTCQSCVERI